MSHPIRNVIYIHTHDMGRYISPYGHQVSTPNLQAFARHGTLFRQAHCCGPTCSPSRAGLLTGVTPHESGMLGLAHRGFKFTHPEHHLAAYLRGQGFLTALCGIQHEFHSAPEQMPYEIVHEENLDTLAATDRGWTQHALDFLNQQHERPFFLSFGLFFPHRPFDPVDPELEPEAYVKPPDPLPDTPEIRKDMAEYRHAVAHSDTCIGRVLDAIRQHGLDKNSLVIITTDHGIAFPRMKCNLTAHGTGVTLMMDYPGNPASGQAVDALVSHLDVYPTVCDLLGLPAPEHLEGFSMRPLFEGSAPEIREDLFSEVSFHAASEPMRSVRTQRYNLIRLFDQDLRRPLSNIDQSPSKALLLKTGWGETPREEIQLYDLLLDPNESRNLAHDPACADILTEMNQRLENWMHDTDDPLLNGPLAQPTGAVINTRESVDPAAGPFIRT
ncbi:sulfatase [Ruficoccus amylovorans]|uniref:Sulfatase n=1 Tax=Ruficoccus amylovorans TaxID=1804625 RepID=A0A842HEJ4_9BACT|nr:sulfatase [Ruficoccus amylovorans]MBC2593997.1 sulfatase [Ruficoccus amylovorans]